MDIKDTSFVFRLNSSLQHEAMRDFLEKVITLLYTKQYMSSNILQLKLSDVRLISMTFVDWSVQIFLNS